MPTRPTVILMTSNGVGMGHMSRQLALALSGTHRFDAVVFSLSGALPRVAAAQAHGELPESAEREVRFEYCPSRASGWLPRSGVRAAARRRYPAYRWEPYLRDRLLALVDEVQASAVVFDGVVVYDGLRAALRQRPGLRSAWVRRGLWQPGVRAARLNAADDFDLVIEPGDHGGDRDRGPTRERGDAHATSPVSLTDVLAPSSRAEARLALGLPAEGNVLLLAPGSGALGSVDAIGRAVLDHLAPSRWTVAVTRQSISRHDIGAGDDRRVVILDDVYPLARHLAAFDAAVSASGYNAVHELIAAGVATALVPSIGHLTDDQAARTCGVAARGLALDASEDLLGSVNALLDDSTRSRLAQACVDAGPAAGGREAAALIASLASDGTPSRSAPNIPRPPRPIFDLRTPAPEGGSRSVVFTPSLRPSDLHGEHPIEHLLAGSSEDYRAARANAAEWVYRIS